MYSEKISSSFYSKILCTIILLLSALGLIFIYSASGISASEQGGTFLFFVKRHCVSMLCGFFAFIITAHISPSFFNRFSWLFLLSSSILTCLTITPLGVCKNGSFRWISLGFIIFQPSELLKIGIILYTATYLSTCSNRSRYSPITYIPLIVIIAGTSYLLLMQPDFGMTITTIMTVIGMLACTPIPLKYFIKGLTLITISAVPFLALRPYRLARISTFLNPWSDPQGKGFQTIQSLIAIGSGGLYGKGLGHSQQKLFYLPMHYTDFIFSIIAEETGFLGCLFIIALYVLFLYMCLASALSMHYSFSAFFTLGFALITSLQALINIFVSSALLPTKGTGLPFISYGGTSFVCNCIMFGIVISALRFEKKDMGFEKIQLM